MPVCLLPFAQICKVGKSKQATERKIARAGELMKAEIFRSGWDGVDDDITEGCGERDTDCGEDCDDFEKRIVWFWQEMK